MFDFEQSTYLGYMVEQHEKEQGNDLFGRPLEDNDDEDDNDDSWSFF